MQELGDAKINQVGVALSIKHHVAGFDVAVNNALLVRVIKRLSNLHEPFGHFTRAGQRASLGNLLAQTRIERAPPSRGA